jgi:hypothetical protein
MMPNDFLTQANKEKKDKYKRAARRSFLFEGIMVLGTQFY